MAKVSLPLKLLFEFFNLNLKYLILLLRASLGLLNTLGGQMFADW